MKSITIALGERTFEIRELTIGQVEQIHDLLQQAGASNHRRAATNRELIAAALSEDHKDVTAENLKGVRIPDIQQLSGAADQILQFGGWVLPEKGASGSAAVDAQRGEAPAG